MGYGYRGGTSNLRAVKCRICGSTVERTKGVKVWCGTDQHKPPTIGFIHRTEVEPAMLRRYKTAPFKIFGVSGWYPYRRKPGRKRNPIIKMIMISLKVSPGAARAFWERHKVELIRELQKRIDKSNPLHTKNALDFTHSEIMQLANLARLPDRIRDYGYLKLMAMVQNMNEHHRPW